MIDAIEFVFVENKWLKNFLEVVEPKTHADKHTSEREREKKDRERAMRRQENAVGCV
jgi:tmRNA-binding protein